MSEDQTQLEELEQSLDATKRLLFTETRMRAVNEGDNTIGINVMGGHKQEMVSS